MGPLGPHTVPILLGHFMGTQLSSTNFSRLNIQGTDDPMAQGGPLAVMNGVITPVSRVMTVVTPVTYL